MENSRKKMKMTCILLILVLSTNCLSDFAKRKIETCSDLSASDLSLTVSEREDKRDDSRISTKFDSDALLKFNKEKSRSALIKPIAGYFSVIIILGVLCFVCFVIYILYMFLFGNYKNTSKKKSKLFCGLTSLFLIGFFALFVSASVYLDRIHRDIDHLECVVNKAAVDVIEGSPNNFLGLENLKIILEDIEKEANSLSSLTTEFDKINIENLDQQGDNTIESLRQFYITFDNTLTRTGTGERETPLVIKEMTNHVSDVALVEFEEIGNVGIDVDKGAKAGLELASENNLSSIKEVAKEGALNLNSTIASLTKTLTNVSNGTKNAIKFMKIFYLISLMTLIFIFVFTGILIFILYKQYKEQKYMDKPIIPKGILFLLSGAAILLVIYSLVGLFYTSGINSFCINNEDFLLRDDATTVLDENGIGFNDDIRKFLQTCLNKDGKSSLASLVNGTPTNTTHVERIEDFLAGVNNYNLYELGIAGNTDGSVEVAKNIREWNLYREHIKFNHNDVQPALDELNSLVSCNDDIFALNYRGCVDIKKNCIPIDINNNYSTPDCQANGTRVSEIFSNLRAYTNDNKDFMNKLIEGLSFPIGDTPQSKFLNLKGSLNKISPYISSINGKLPESFGTLNSFNGRFEDLIDCEIVRKEFLDIETVVCFQHRSDFYAFFVITAISSTVAFFMNLFLFLGLRYVPKKERRRVPRRDSDEDKKDENEVEEKKSDEDRQYLTNPQENQT